MSSEENHQSASIEEYDSNVIHIGNEPIMQTALNLLNKFSTTKKIILVAKGEQIPNAVAVANIITENMLKGNSKIDDVLLDSEINNENLMLSNIKITLLKN
jgi:DNA-binding protein|tara:strand:- start:1545 stop:1847 length:303 start_codon:yes stop_codon:yes gene_type:complete